MKSLMSVSVKFTSMALDQPTHFICLFQVMTSDWFDTSLV